MHLVFSCVIEICNAIDVLILKRPSKQKRQQSVQECNDHTNGDIKHQDKTGLGSESFKHTQPLDIDEDEGTV